MNLTFSKRKIFLLSILYSLNITFILSLEKFMSTPESSSRLTTSPVNISNYQYPTNTDSSGNITIAIVGTNDIHGQAYERDFTFNNETYQVGGYKLLSGLIDILKKEFNENILWFDAGDQFTGTVESMRSNGTLMVDFYNALKVDSVTLGNHEWDNKEARLRQWMLNELGRYYDPLDPTWSKEKYGDLQKNLYMNSNIEFKPTEDKKDDLPNTMQTKMFEFKNGKIKIGVIGLSTIETAIKTTGFNSKNFKIIDYKSVVEKLSAEFRNKGAQAVIILSHVGTRCIKPNPSKDFLLEYFKLSIRGKDYNKDYSCNGEMTELLLSLEKGVVDAVVAGHVHQSVHQYINNVPVVQNPMSNIFSNVLYMKFNIDSNGNYTLASNDTLIEGPIPICSKIYSNTERCDEYQDLADDVKLTEFIFHGQKLIPNANVEKIFLKNQDLNDLIVAMKKK